MKSNRELVILFTVLWMTQLVRADEIHVATDGTGDGSAAAPRSLDEAMRRARPGDRVLLHAGIWREVLRPPSGLPGAPIVIETAGDGPVIFSGCEPIEGWRRDGPGLYSAACAMEDSWNNQVFVDGRMLWLARWPNAPQGALLEFPKAVMGEGSGKGQVVDPQLPEGDWKGARIWASSSKRWYSWTSVVNESATGRLRFKDVTDVEGKHLPAPGGVYALIGAACAFDAPWEWWYDRTTGRLAIRLPESLEPGLVEIKRREVAIDLCGRKHVVVRGLRAHAATIVTDCESSHCHLEKLQVLHPYHSWIAEQTYGSQIVTGVQLRGSHHRLLDSEIAFSSGDGVSLQATDCEIVNCFIHDVDYIGSYASAVSLIRIPQSDETSRPSRRNLISHCTMSRSGRTLIGLSSFYDSVIQFCDLSDAGFLTWDLGLVYGNSISGGGSEFRYNQLHDVRSEHLGMGLYYDHGCQNILSHHNLIWNVDYSGLQNNLSAQFLLWYRNTTVSKEHGYRSQWAAAQPAWSYGTRVEQNAFRHEPLVEAELCEPLVLDNYIGEIPMNGGRPAAVGGKPQRSISGLVGPCTQEQYGAICPSHPWRAGHDFTSPPNSIPHQRSVVLHRNRLINAAFEAGEDEGWKREGKAVLVYQRRNRNQWVTDGKGRMGSWSVLLPSCSSSVWQRVESIEPDTEHELVLWLRSVNHRSTATLRVTGLQGKVIKATKLRTEQKWNPYRVVIPVAEGPWKVRIYGGVGGVYLDDTGLRVLDSSE